MSVSSSAAAALASVTGAGGGARSALDLVELLRTEVQTLQRERNLYKQQRDELTLKCECLSVRFRLGSRMIGDTVWKKTTPRQNDEKHFFFFFFFFFFCFLLLSCARLALLRFSRFLWCCRLTSSGCFVLFFWNLSSLSKKEKEKKTREKKGKKSAHIWGLCESETTYCFRFDRSRPDTAQKQQQQQQPTMKKRFRPATHKSSTLVEGAEQQWIASRVLFSIPISQTYSFAFLLLHEA